MITKIQVFEKIKAQLGQNQQISDRTINDTLETLMSFVTEETELNTFVSLISPTFTSMDGNLRHEVAEKAKAIEDAAKAKVKTPEEIAAEATAAAEKLKMEAEEPAWAKAARLKQEAILDELRGQIATVTATKTVDQLRTNLIAKSETAYTKDSLEKIAKRFDFSRENAEVEFEEMCKDFGTPIGVTPAAGVGAIANPTAAGFAAQKEELIKQGIIPKDELKSE